MIVDRNLRNSFYSSILHDTGLVVQIYFENNFFSRVNDLNSE